MKTAIYERVSHHTQQLAGQHRELEVWSKAQEGEVVWFTDKATGKKMARPGFDRLWQEVLEGKINRIVVWRLDRLGRTSKGLVNLFADLHERKVTLVSLKDGFDLATPTGRMVAVILASVAAYEVEVLTEKQQAGIAAAKEATEKGERVYFNKGTPRRKARKLTAEKVAVIKELHKQGTKVAAIARQTGIARKTVYEALRQ